MRRQIAPIVCALVMCGAALAQSGSALITWTPATTYTNGAPLVLASQRFYVARTSEAACNVSVPPTTFGDQDVVGPGIASLSVNNLWNGTYYWYGVSRDAAGTDSAPSNYGCKRIDITGNNQPPPVPRPPTNLQVQ